MRFIDLFAGIGGFHYGIEKAIYAECVYSNEWDKYANSVYRRHYGICDNRDIRMVKAEEIPDHELLVGGFPCQSFSIAGKRGGFNDTRGTLFFEIARILKEKQPRLCLLENVKGLLSHDNGRTIKIILSTLTELGYDVQWQVLNSKNHGVPQNRERIFIIGHLRGTPRPKVFPIGESYKKDTRSIGEDVAYTIDANYWKGTNTIEKGRRSLVQIHGGSQGNRVYSIDGISTTIASQAGGLGAKTGLYAVPLKFLERNQKNYQGDYSFTIDSVNTGGIMKDMKIRRLTPIECERLQGFPDNWTQYGSDGELISDTQRYKMCGNAVTTNVITDIVKRIV